jgi:hypothetical protein
MPRPAAGISRRRRQPGGWQRRAKEIWKLGQARAKLCRQSRARDAVEYRPTVSFSRPGARLRVRLPG